MIHGSKCVKYGIKFYSCLKKLYHLDQGGGSEVGSAAYSLKWDCASLEEPVLPFT